LASLSDGGSVAVELLLVQLGDAQPVPDGPGRMLRYVGNGRRARHRELFSVTA
jgi:hypothetical protein